jgi:hypothetical protein
VKARALPWIVAAVVLLLACGQRVQIGAETDPLPPLQLPSPGNICLSAACGATCPLTTSTCTGDDCPPTISGYCSDGVCTPDLPTCVIPVESCAGIPCGKACPDVVTNPNNPPPLAFCDGTGHCVMGPIDCGPCVGKPCGAFCGDCDPAGPGCNSDAGAPTSDDGGTPTSSDAGLWMRCDAFQQCQANPDPCL